MGEMAAAVEDMTKTVKESNNILVDFYNSFNAVKNLTGGAICTTQWFPVPGVVGERDAAQDFELL